MPQGEDYYAYLARRHTSTAMTPAAIHELGEREVRRIRGRMDEAIAATGFKGTFQEFLAAVRKDARFYVGADAYGEKASEIAKRADFAMPRYFGRLPRLSYGVRPMPDGLESSANGYLPGTPEQGIAGMVVYKPWMAEKMPTFGLPAWVLHEGVPGHHHQIALSQELTELPEFRRADDVTAYVEGWGLYSEFLGEEMGIYRDPYEQFGRLSLEIWRACRLVIDTGMHVMGWSRERAMACLQENSALAPAEIEFEVDRYIAWPGQALAYKIGELKLIELRRRATERLGPKFDLREFHDLVLGAGPMPLDVLEDRVERWIATAAAAVKETTILTRNQRSCHLSNGPVTYSPRVIHSRGKTTPDSPRVMPERRLRIKNLEMVVGDGIEPSKRGFSTRRPGPPDLCCGDANVFARQAPHVYKYALIYTYQWRPVYQWPKLLPFGSYPRLGSTGRTSSRSWQPPVGVWRSSRALPPHSEPGHPDQHPRPAGSQGQFGHREYRHDARRAVP